jgi:histidinol-phosphate aminotransferase
MTVPLTSIVAGLPGVSPLDRCIHISTAPDDELDVLAGELPGALAAASRST